MENKKENKFDKYIRKFPKVLQKTSLSVRMKIQTEKSFAFSFSSGKFDQKKYFLTLSILDTENIPISHRDKLEELCEQIQEKTMEDPGEVIIDFNRPEAKLMYSRDEHVYSIEKNFIDFTTGKNSRLKFENGATHTLMVISNLSDPQADKEVINELIKIKANYKDIEVIYAFFNSDDEKSNDQAWTEFKTFVKDSNNKGKLKFFYWAFTYEERKYLDYFGYKSLVDEQNPILYSLISKSGKFNSSFVNFAEANDKIKSILENKESSKEVKKIQKYEPSPMTREDVKKFESIFKDYCPKNLKKIVFEWTSFDITIKSEYYLNKDKFEHIIYEKPLIQVNLPKRMKGMISDLKNVITQGKLDLSKVELKEDVLDHEEQAKLILGELINNKELNVSPKDIQLIENFSVNSRIESKLLDVINKEKIEALDIDRFNKLQLVEEKIRSNKNYNRVFKDTHMIPLVGVGDPFVRIDHVLNVETGEEASILHQPGEVMIIQFWQASSDYSFEKVIQWNDLYLKNHDNWQGNLSIIGIAYDQIDFIEYLNDKFALIENNLIHHFLLNGAECHDLKFYIDLYCKEFDPEVTIIVNKSGHVAFCGNIENLNLETFIKSLIIDKEENLYYLKEGKSEVKKNLASLDKSKFKILKEKLYNSCSSFREMSNLNELEFKGKKSFRFDDEYNKTNQEILELSISGKLRIKDYSKFVEMIDKEVNSKLISKEALNLDIKTINTIDLNFGQKCMKCSKILSDKEAQFFCFKCSFYYCVECGDKTDSTKKFLKKYLHPHNMIYIKVSNSSGMKDIEESKLGQNKILDLKLMPGEEEPVNHGANCNFCRNEIVGQRFICLTCRPSSGDTCDFCHECFSVISNPQHKDYADFAERIYEKDGHDIKTHVYLRLNFSTGNCLDY